MDYMVQVMKKIEDVREREDWYICPELNIPLPLRYTFFFVLYPLGAGSEWILMYHSLDAAKAIHPNFYYGLIFILVMYVPGFYILYSHMIKQRTKFLGGSSGGGGGSQNKKTRVSKKAE